MPVKKYIVKLESDERQQLLALTRRGEIGARKVNYIPPEGGSFGGE